ncbi:MAG TPA: serine/threonine-protein kinase [Polyangiales bacterium]|nr:serine/threonine-protein kinase [Polyangiales bacterium]
MASAAPLPQPGDTVAGKYVIDRVIGQGGMSVVYGATHTVTGKRFAIKWLLPEDAPASGDTARRFIREAQVAGLFQHPNVVEVYDVGEVAGSFYMVMQWLEGESLAARLERVGSLSFEQTCEYLIPCMRGVEEAHAAGIVHRDLKPANIFLCRATHHTPERTKVLDFGIAKISKHAFDANSLVTKSGVLIGTPHYLSPEQLRTEPVDHRTDVYALGVIMYQLLSGQLPFPAENFGKLVLEIATGTPTPLLELVPDLPPEAAAIVERAMAREPADRYQDVRSLIEALEAACPNLPQDALEARSSRPARPSGNAQPPAAAPSPMRRVAAYLAILAVLVGGGVLLAWLLVEPPSAAPSVAREVPPEPPATTTTTSAVTASPDPPPAEHPPVAEVPSETASPQPSPAEPAPQPARPRTPKRNPRGAPPAPAQPPAPAEPAAEPERNPLHMRLQ